MPCGRPATLSSRRATLRTDIGNDPGRCHARRGRDRSAWPGSGDGRRRAGADRRAESAAAGGPARPVRSRVRGDRRFDRQPVGGESTGDRQKNPSEVHLDVARASRFGRGRHRGRRLRIGFGHRPDRRRPVRSVAQAGAGGSQRRSARTGLGAACPGAVAMAGPTPCRPRRCPIRGGRGRAARRGAARGRRGSVGSRARPRPTRGPAAADRAAVRDAPVPGTAVGGADGRAVPLGSPGRCAGRVPPGTDVACR